MIAIIIIIILVIVIVAQAIYSYYLYQSYVTITSNIEPALTRLKEWFKLLNSQKNNQEAQLHSNTGGTPPLSSNLYNLQGGLTTEEPPPNNKNYQSKSIPVGMPYVIGPGDIPKYNSMPHITWPVSNLTKGDANLHLNYEGANQIVPSNYVPGHKLVSPLYMQFLLNRRNDF